MIDFAELREIADTMCDDEHEAGALARGVIELLDERAKLHAALPNLMAVKPEDLEALCAENDELRARDAKITEWCKSITNDAISGKDGATFKLNMWHCTWCKESGVATDTDHTEARAHDATCTKHPAMVENARLREQLASYEQLAAGHA